MMLERTIRNLGAALLCASTLAGCSDWPRQTVGGVDRWLPARSDWMVHTGNPVADTYRYRVTARLACESGRLFAIEGAAAASGHGTGIFLDAEDLRLAATRELATGLVAEADRADDRLAQRIDALQPQYAAYLRPSRECAR